MAKVFLSTTSGDNKWSGQTDDALIQHFQATRDSTTFAALFNRYAHLVYGACLKFVDNRETGKDLTMKVFEKALTQLPDANVQSFNHWIYSVTRNTCISEVRGQQKDTTKVESWKNFEKSGEQVVENGAFLRLCSEDQLTAADYLEQSLQELDAEQQQCVRLFYYERQSYQAIAQTTGYTLQEVKSYLQNGKKRLRTLISRRMRSQG